MRDKRDDDRGTEFGGGLRFLQENLRKSGPAVMAGYMLIAAILLGGGIGYLVDRWLDTAPWFLVGGLLFGVAAGFVELARIVWRR